MAESDGFSGEIKTRNTTYFVGEVKPSFPCCKILRHVKDPLRDDRDTDRQNSTDITCSVSPRFATRSLQQPEQTTLVDESGMIKTQMSSTIHQKIVAVVWDTLYTIPPRYSNQYCIVFVHSLLKATISVTHTMLYSVELREDTWMMNFKGYVMKRSWPTLRYNPDIFLEGLRKPRKTVHVAGLRAENCTRALPNTKQEC
jgi:hypothetical protein